MLDYAKEDIVGRECIFATYAENKALQTDALVVKENLHLKDGRIIPNLSIIKDKEWPFWTTREGFRNHKDQKEYEELSRLQKRKSTRVKLVKNIKNALNVYKPNATLRDLGESPYLYGTDILPSSLIKYAYRKKWPEASTLTKTVAALDLETDVVNGTEDVIIANITYNGKSYSAITKQWIGDNPDFINKCHRRAMELAPEDFKDLEWTIEIVDSPAEACYRMMMKAHEWQPDFISIWNMKFDIPKMVDMFTKEGYDLAEVFSDPRVPREYRFFDWIEGPAVKVKRTGEKTPIHMADRWHVCTCPATFYFIDAMCLYKRIRVAEGNLPGYSLDAILDLNGLPAKLKIKELESVEKDGNQWHHDMQKYYKVEYAIYNVIDDKRLLDLDKVTNDISKAFPVLAGWSDYSVFHKNPRRIADDLHFFYLDRGKVVGSTSPNLADDPLDTKVVGLSGWPATLPSYLINNGMHLFKDAPDIQTMIYRYLSD